MKSLIKAWGLLDPKQTLPSMVEGDTLVVSWSHSSLGQAKKLHIPKFLYSCFQHLCILSSRARSTTISPLLQSYLPSFGSLGLLGRSSWEWYPAGTRAFVRSMHHVCMGRGQGDRGRESHFCVKARKRTRHWKNYGQERIPTAQQYPCMASPLDRELSTQLWSRALRQGGYCILLLWLGRCSCLYSVLGLWVSSSGQTLLFCDPEATMG